MGIGANSIAGNRTVDPNEILANPRCARIRRGIGQVSWTRDMLGGSSRGAPRLPRLGLGLSGERDPFPSRCPMKKSGRTTDQPDNSESRVPAEATPPKRRESQTQLRVRAERAL